MVQLTDKKRYKIMLVFLCIVTLLYSIDQPYLTPQPLLVGGGSGGAANETWTRLEFEITVKDTPELELKSAEVIEAQTDPNNYIPASDGSVRIECDVNYLYEDDIQDVTYFERAWKQDKTYLVVVYDFGIRSMHDFLVYVRNQDTGQDVEDTIQAENKASGTGQKAADQMAYYFENQMSLTLGIEDNTFFVFIMALPMLGLLLGIAFGMPILIVVFTGVACIFLFVAGAGIIMFYATNQEAVPGMNVINDSIDTLEGVSWAAGRLIDFLIFLKTAWLFLYVFLSFLVFVARFVLPFIILVYILKWITKLSTFMQLGGKMGNILGRLKKK